MDKFDLKTATQTEKLLYNAGFDDGKHGRNRSELFCENEAYNEGWNRGLMIWRRQWPD